MELIVLAAGYAFTAVVSYGVSSVVSILTKPKERKTSEVQPAPPAIDPLSSRPEPSGPKIGIFGHRRVGGRIVLNEKSGDTTFIVYALANKPLTSINAVFVNNQIVTLNGSDQVTDRPWANPAGTQFSMTIRLYDGTQVAADAGLIAAFPGWTSDHVGYDTAYAVVEIDPSGDTAYFNESYAAGVPDITFDVCGFPVYDPREVSHDVTDPSTWAYSDNVSLCRATYMIHPLGAKLPPTMIDWDSVEAAADHDDEAVTLKNGGTEKRYTCTAYWTTDQRHEDVLAKFSAANAGGSFPSGAKFRIYSGVFDSSTASVGVDDYEGAGISWADTPPLGERVNGVRGQFTSPVHNYEMRDFPAYQDAAALSFDADGMGLTDAEAEEWLDLNLEFVTSHSQAQRLARIAYNKAREGFDAAVTLKFKHFDVIANDVITITDPLAGFSAKTFRVTSDELDEEYRVNLKLEHETAAFYAWTAATDEADFVAEDPLLGEGGKYQPPGFALVDVNAGANVTPELVLWESPTAGWINFTSLMTDVGGLDRAKGQTITNYGVTFAPGTALTGGAPSSNAQLKVRNLTLGASFDSDDAIIQPIGATWGVISGMTEATTTFYVLPPPKAPLLASAFSGVASLFLRAAPGLRSTHLELWENSVNDFGTASLISTVANSDQNVAVTGNPGEVKFYWARVKNTPDTKFGPESRVALVVF